MSATITDYFNKASNMGGSYPAVATVTAARSTGGSTLSCDDLSSWATDTPVHFSTFEVNTDGTIDTATQTDWKGIVNGNTITDMTRLAGAADSGNASGDRVELNPTVGWLDDLITGILVSHKQNGALKDNAVTESSIATGAVTSSKVASGAISSYDKIGDDVIQARNINTNSFATQRLTFTSKDTKTSGTEIATYTVTEAGIYLLSANICFQRNGGGNTELLLWGRHNTDSLGNVGAYTANDNRRTPVSGTWIVKANANDTLSVMATSVDGNIWANASFSEIYVAQIA